MEEYPGLTDSPRPCGDILGCRSGIPEASVGQDDVQLIAELLSRPTRSSSWLGVGNESTSIEMSHLLAVNTSVDYSCQL